MQYKHVDVIKGEWKYLRLSLPPSKGHKYPITTMPWAGRVYERIKARNEGRGKAGKEDLCSCLTSEPSSETGP